MVDETIENTEEAAEVAGQSQEGVNPEPPHSGFPVGGSADTAAAGPAVQPGEPSEEGGPEPAAEAPVMQAKPATRIQPDIKFVKEVIGGGGTDLKKCFQCATCSVVCNVTPDDHPFPRKEMIWAQWGLKDKLVADPDIWLCHQCNDCTAQCPRDAKPGRVMQAIAKMSIPSLSKPGFIAKGIGSPSTLLLMAAIPVIIVALLIGLAGDYTPERGEKIGTEIHHAGDIVYASFLGHWPIVGAFSTFFVLSIIIFALGVRNYWGMMKQHAADEGAPISGSGMSQVGPVLTEIATHERFGKCDETKDRKVSHLFIFYAFGLLFIATIISTLFTDLPLLWGGEGVLSPYPTISFVKLFAYTGAVAGAIGITLIIINRFKHQEKVGAGSYFDWLLIVVVLLLMVTGIGAAAFRLLDIGVLAYPTYFAHLSTVMFLFMYAPFSKMAHMVYRATAMAFARSAGRDTPM
jgi:quinone-modifying oxidoreductase subunit QmoC